MNGRFATGNLGRIRAKTHPYASGRPGVFRGRFNFGDRYRIDLIFEGFNLFNRFNEASVTPFFTDVNAFNQRADNGRYYSRPTACIRFEAVSAWAKFTW